MAENTSQPQDNLSELINQQWCNMHMTTITVFARKTSPVYHLLPRTKLFIRGFPHPSTAHHNLPRKYNSLIHDKVKRPIRPDTHQLGETRLHTAPRGPSRPCSHSSDTTSPKSTNVAAEAAATAVVAIPAPVHQLPPPTHTMATRRRAPLMQEDRGTPG